MSIKSVAEYHLRKLPHELEDMIRWWATEPSPTAKIMHGLTTKYTFGGWRDFMTVTHSSTTFRKCKYSLDDIHDVHLNSAIEFDWNKRDVIRFWMNRGRITKAWWEDELEQDRIAKALEPVVAEYNLRKLPHEKTFAIRDIPLDAEPTCRWCT